MTQSLHACVLVCITPCGQVGCHASFLLPNANIPPSAFPRCHTTRSEYDVIPQPWLWAGRAGRLLLESEAGSPAAHARRTHLQTKSRHASAVLLSYRSDVIVEMHHSGAASAPQDVRRQRFAAACGMQPIQLGRVVCRKQNIADSLVAVAARHTSNWHSRLRMSAHALGS